MVLGREKDIKLLARLRVCCRVVGLVDLYFSFLPFFIETFKYQLVSFDIMNTQVNVRLPDKLLVVANSYAEQYGYGTVQELIKESLREKVFDEVHLTAEELVLVHQLAEVTKKRNLFKTEKELFEKLRR